MADNLTRKIIKTHLVDGSMTAGESLSLRPDQTLCQDATGTLVMLTLEAMGLNQAQTELSAQYVDHNLIQEDHKNPDDHAYLLEMARKLGIYYSRPGNGISHPLHMQHFAIPGKMLIGSDSHTCANGGMAMLAVGVGGADVALAIAGKPINLTMPKVWGVELQGKLPDWVSAKDIILRMLMDYDVEYGVGKVIEYHGPGITHLSALDRHVIANMGAELGATASIFPADKRTLEYLKSVGREGDFVALEADAQCDYDEHTTLDLATLEPLIAQPSSPDKVVPVATVAGKPISQAYIGSSANPGFRDYAIVAEIVAHQTVAEGVSLDINPSTRDVLTLLSDSGHLNKLLHAGARLHQAGCNGCIGMGQAPASNTNSLRTTPRNFPGRSGTTEDKVWLCSPETAAASALKGEITDPRSLNMPYPTPAHTPLIKKPVEIAKPDRNNIPVNIQRGPNIAPLPKSNIIEDEICVPVLLRVGEGVSTDEILPAGAEVLPYRSNIPKIADFVFAQVDKEYASHARQTAQGHAIVAGRNYGQGSSREHAALAPAFLGLKVVIAKSFARIHYQNLINFGVLPLTFITDDDYSGLSMGDEIRLQDVHRCIREESKICLLTGDHNQLTLNLSLSATQREVILCGGIVPWVKQSQQ